MHSDVLGGRGRLGSGVANKICTIGQLDDRMNYTGRAWNMVCVIYSHVGKTKAQTVMQLNTECSVEKRPAKRGKRRIGKGGLETGL